MKYGDVVRWKKPAPGHEEQDEPFGRFMYVGPYNDLGTVFEYVMCLVAGPDTDWRVGDIEAVNVTQLEVAE